MHISSNFETVSQSSILPVVPINQTTNALNIPYEHNGIVQQQGHESFENRRIVPKKIASAQRRLFEWLLVFLRPF